VRPLMAAMYGSDAVMIRNLDKQIDRLLSTRDDYGSDR